MNTHDFWYDLPEHFIAQTPKEPRDTAKLLIYDKQQDIVSHHIFRDILDDLHAGDVLVINNTRVLPARLYGRKQGTDREVEFLLLERKDAFVWDIIMRPGKKLKVHDVVIFSEKLSAEILEKKDDGVTSVCFSYTGVFEEILDELGEMPLPPYITTKLEDKERYQTVYSKEEGSAAAPTAGLHFTPELLEQIKSKGVEIVEVLLHVGLGTFRPVKTDDLSSHQMHSEYYRISKESAEAINKAKREGRRVIAVGTTSVRTLESAADENGLVKETSAYTDIFIYPGYRFRCIDALITNFHLPESTLVMLVSALIGREKTLELYEIAKKENYRFFSFGDAMFLK